MSAGVIAGDREAGVARAAYDFVDRVEESQDADLDGGAMWAGERGQHR